MKTGEQPGERSRCSTLTFSASPSSGGGGGGGGGPPGGGSSRSWGLSGPCGSCVIVSLLGCPHMNRREVRRSAVPATPVRKKSRFHTSEPHPPAAHTFPLSPLSAALSSNLPHGVHRKVEAGREPRCGLRLAVSAGGHAAACSALVD